MLTSKKPKWSLMQNEIKDKTTLLTYTGRLAVRGFAKHLVFDFDRASVKRPQRLKEWDFYQITDGDYVLQMNMSDLYYFSTVSVTLFNLKTGKKYSAAINHFFSKGTLNLEKNGEADHVTTYVDKDFLMRFDVQKDTRHLSLNAIDDVGQKFVVDLWLYAPAQSQAMVIATPFSRHTQFFLNYKLNCLRAIGTVTIGDLLVRFGEKAFGLLDWGRGVWPFKNQWFWGNGATKLKDGRYFGFNLGFGFGNPKNATENMIFLDGVAHKLDQITLTRDEKDLMKPWVFQSNDKRFEMTMTPTYDNYTHTKYGPVFLECHQVFGLFNGKVVTDTGEVLTIKDMLAFCEHAKNQW